MGTVEQRMRERLSPFAGGLIGRGVVAVLAAILVLVWPAITVAALVMVLGVYTLVDGGIALGTAFTASGSKRWWSAAQGVAGIVVGLLILFWPGLTAFVLLHMIGTWAIVLGAIAIGAAFTGDRAGSDRVLMGLYGALGVLLGIVIWWRPDAGAVAVVTLIAGITLVIGATQIAVGMQLRGGR